jgi:excisionase family DNA binding protein
VLRRPAKLPQSLSDSAQGLAAQLPVSRKNLTKPELARELRVSMRTIDTWMQQKKIPYKKLSPHLVRFDLDQVEKALERYTVKEIR